MRNPTLLRILVLLALVAMVEALCRTGYITNFTMQPPTRIVQDLWKILASGKLNHAIAKTLTNASIAFALALVIGIVTALLIHARKLVREALDPLFATYYAIPVIAFYPLFVILFGLGDGPQIIIAFMLGVVAVIVNTLNGLDRVPRVLLKTARVTRMSPSATALRITLPFAMPYILTGATVFLITHALDEAAMLADRIGVMSARPGRLLEIVEPGWPRERDSRIVEDPRFGATTARLWQLLREESLKSIPSRAKS